MQKGWFNQWKMKYVTCLDQKLCIYKSKGDKEGTVFNMINCSIKLIEQSRWNRKYCFRVKTSNNKLYFAAEDENMLAKWTNTIQGRVQRASLLGAGVIRPRNENDKQPEEQRKRTRKSSTIASLSRGDILGLMGFNQAKYIESFAAAVGQPEDPTAQFEFAERCGEFLAISHAQSGPLFNMNKIKEIQGFNVQFLNKEERKEKMRIIHTLASIVDMHIPGVFVPLQCIIDFCGKTLFFESKIDSTTETLTQKNVEILGNIPFSPQTVKAVQDEKGRLWITEAKEAKGKPSEQQLNDFIEKLDNMEYFVFDSQSLNEVMDSNKIPISTLSTLADITKIPSIRVLLQTEMIGRACKKLFNETMETKIAGQRNEEVVNFFNLVLGNDDDSKKFWTEKLIPTIKEKYGADIDRNIPLLHMPQLFFTLQYHTGADFSDINTYDFTQPKPLKVEQLNSFNAVPHHSLVQMCFSMRKLKSNPIELINNGFYEEAMLLINNQVSVYQSIYGDENIFVALGLSLLSSAYCGIGDQDKAVLCANGALNAGRVYHCALVPAYMSLIQTALPNEIDDYLKKARTIISFQLGDNHWLIADVLFTAAKAYQACEKKELASASIVEASELVETLLGSSHPKTARCILTQGKISRCARQYAVAESLIQQAIYSMKAAYGDKSVQYAECLYEFADVLIDEGRNDEAITYATQAIAIRNPVYDADSVPVIESVQQLAVIYDQLNNDDKAYEYYRKLLTFLKKIEDEPIFQEMVRIIRNVLCLFFRTIGSTHRQLINQIRRRQLPNAHDLIVNVFKQIIDTDPIIFAKNQVDIYQRSAETSAFDNLAALYHIATDDVESLQWLDGN